MSLRHSPATLKEEAAPASSEVRCNASEMAPRLEKCVVSPEGSASSWREEPACGPDTPLAPLGCAPITIPRAKGARVGSLPFGDTGEPAGLRVWTLAMPQERRRPDILRTASQASSASGSQETPAGVRLGTPAWNAWRRRRDLLHARSQESDASGAETPAGPAEGTPAWQVNHYIGRAARAPVDFHHHDLVEAGRLAETSTLKRAHSEADTLPLAAPQVAGVGQSKTEVHGDKDVLVSPKPSSYAMARCMSCLRTGGNFC